MNIFKALLFRYLAQSGKIVVVIIAMLLPNIFLYGQSNYQYDADGRLIADLSEGIVKIEWNNKGKVTRIIRADTSHLSDIGFAYDAQGNRRMKVVMPRDGNGLMPESAWMYTHYVLDIKGNCLALYERNYKSVDAATGSFEEECKMIEQHIYSSAKIGYQQSDDRLVTHTFTASLDIDGRFQNRMNEGNVVPAFNADVSRSMFRGNKRYAIQNHAENVLVVVNDRRVHPLSIGAMMSHNNADLASANDYYPFGMTMPSRKFNNNTYRYGFSNKEKDDEINGEGGVLNFGARFYDARLGRFLSLDPAQEKYPSHSPFSYALNSPLMFNDPSGKSAKYTITGKNIIISSTVYITGAAATSAMVKEINDVYKQWLKPGTYYSDKGEFYNISFKVTAVFDPDGTKNLHPGENRFVLTPGQGRASVNSSSNEGELFSGGEPGFAGELLTARKHHTYAHETLHFLGLSDRYIEPPTLLSNIPLLGGLLRIIDTWQHTDASVADAQGTGKDIMGNPNCVTRLMPEGYIIGPSRDPDNINQVHFDNLGRAILKLAEKNGPKGHIEGAIDTNGSGKLIGNNLTPEQEANRRSMIGAGLTIQSMDFLRKQELNKEDFKGPYRP